MRVNYNGVTRDMTPAEEAAYLAEHERMAQEEAQREPTPEERIAALEAIIESQALALESLGVTGDD